MTKEARKQPFTETLATVDPNASTNISSLDEKDAITSQKVLDLAEIDHMRRLHVLVISAYITLIGLVLIEGDRSWFGMLAIGGALVGIASSLLTLAIIRDPKRVNAVWMIPILVPTYGAAFVGTYYIGFFSPVLALYAVALYTVSNSAVGTGGVRIAYACVAGSYAIGTFGIALGLLPNRGLIHPEMSGPHSRGLFVFAITIQIILFGTFLFARRNVKALRASVTQFESVLREASRREALLNEAKQELKRERLLLNAVNEGRSTGMTVGSWKLGVVLGRGGMGEVYEAVHVTNEAMIAAVKLLPEDALHDPDAAARFQREARVLETLNNAHIVKVFEVGETFIAMERLEGSDLADVLRDRAGALPLEEAVSLITQVANGLEAARVADVVHRDVKPRNIFFVEKARIWKVLDFGVSKLGHSGTLTQGMIVGTPMYMAPEQLNGSSVDHRADVFSLAAVAFRAITGQPAFSGPDEKVFHDVFYMQPSQPSQLANVPPDVDLALALGLAKSASDRFVRATELADALSEASRGALSDSLRKRAAALVAKHGWGERID